MSNKNHNTSKAENNNNIKQVNETPVHTRPSNSDEIIVEAQVKMAEQVTTEIKQENNAGESNMKNLKDVVKAERESRKIPFNKQKVLAASAISGGSTILSLGIMKAFTTEEEMKEIPYSVILGTGVVAGTLAAGIQATTQFVFNKTNSYYETNSMLFSSIAANAITGMLLPLAIEKLDQYKIDGEKHVEVIEVSKEEY